MSLKGPFDTAIVDASPAAPDAGSAKVKPFFASARFAEVVTAKARAMPVSPPALPPVLHPAYYDTAPPPEPQPVTARPAKRPAPFSIRLSPQERARLVAEAAGAPVGAYIKAKVLGGDVPAPVRRHRVAAPLADRQALARILALLGSSRLSSNLNQLAHAANIGVLTMDAETDAESAVTLRSRARGFWRVRQSSGSKRKQWARPSGRSAPPSTSA